MIITMWIPETIHFILNQPGNYFYPVWFDTTRQIMGIVWPRAIATVGIWKFEQIKWYWAVIFAVIAAVPMLALMVVFIR